ncbi:hypothetical protein ACA910_021280 [Epithemia clementina (nom. ined.)]
MSILIRGGLLAAVGAFVETKYGPSVQLTGPGGTNPLFFATPLVFIGVGFFSLAFGMEVGKARRKYEALAKKDGEENVEERYALPNLYAQGTSKHAKAFNAVQRAHQHIFESFTSTLLFGLAGAMEFPIAAALSSLAYATGRVIFSTNYSQCEGDVAQRYTRNPLARSMWYGIVTNFFLGTFACIKILASTRRSGIA